MAKDNVDDILVRLDEIEKLQTELRHLVPRVTSNSSRHAGHQDLSSDSPASIRFPSLFTFPVISSIASTSKNERVQKSTARLNLINSKPLSGNRHSTVNLKSAGRSSQSGTRGINVFKNLLRSGNNITSPHTKHSSVSVPVTDSRTSTRNSIVNRVSKQDPRAIKKRLKGETSKTATTDKTQRTIGEKSSVQLSGNEKTSDIRAHETEATQSQNACLRNRYYNRNGTLIKQIMEKLNYCFVDNKRVTIPYHYPGDKIPRRVKTLHSLTTIKETEISRLHESMAKMFVN